ncbi:DUF5309 domain-containing protein [Campylobacter sp. VicNov18]|uniref:SU10 major capsid protein n=1 Tax=Campylobacter bilis TaxID=2691918 RepID=UPI00130E1A2D|nr:DUF5309 family protein [Campylobacter bilis]MPV63206.1 hypothetical protein [Campylobacter hepaticus]MCC8277549.1 DUF5309 domain-containing protein [Campylobacter bilis]MCC8298754.1 DUF5309 domain-containing protein [Campylobacter bilis]MCC8300458.1 DUF5309 domain-containing protein [Campylobacter bilis]MCC8349861.1 DUF5309 domain-containing protein [Campylobacter bilis]
MYQRAPNGYRIALLGLGRDSDVKKSVFKEYVNTQESTPGEMAGLFYYIAKGQSSFTHGKKGNVLAFDSSKDWSGTATELTEDKLNDILQTIWDNGTTPKDVFVGAKLKRTINKIATRIISNEKKFALSIISLDTDFGTVNFHLHRFLSAEYGLGDVLIAGDFEFMKHGLFIPTDIKDLPITSTGQAKRLLTESTLVVLNPDAFAIGVGLKA